MKLSLPIALVFSALLSSAASAATVMGSIKPISLIAADLLQGVAEVDTLLPEGASPHDYALRPSDRRRIAETDLLIWVGPQTEPYLEKIIAASDIDALAWQEEGEEHADEPQGGHEPGQDQSQPHKEDQHDDHEAMHPWLSPESAEHFAEQITELLVSKYPKNVDKIEENLAKFLESIELLNNKSEAKLADKKTIGFFVFHDAYQGLVSHFGLNQVGYFTLDPSRKPGAKHLSELRSQLEENKISCVFVEPQFSPAVIEAITRGLNINEGKLDPLASGIEVQAGGYVAFIAGLVDQFDSCLAP
jgi:zinc transport system substrate-binding protein